MEPLDLYSVNWQPGMLIRHDHFEVSDRRVRAHASWVLRHAGRYGVVRPPGSTLPAVELDNRIERDHLVVRVRRCIAITPGGGLIDIQPPSDLDPELMPEARLEIDHSAQQVRVPVILECLPPEFDHLTGEPEPDGRLPRRLPRVQVHLDTKGVADPSWSLRIAELLVEAGRITESTDFFPVTPWVQALPALTEAFLDLHERADRLRDLLVNHLKRYHPDRATQQKEYPILRGIVSELVFRLGMLEWVRPGRRAHTAPEEALTAFLTVLDGFRSVIESNSQFYDAVRAHYTERQPPVNPRAIDFLRDLMAVRGWRLDLEAVGLQLPRIAALFDHLLLAFDEPIREMLGPAGEPAGPVERGRELVYKGKRYTMIEAEVLFQKDHLAITGLPPEVINQILIKFPRQNLPTGRRYGVRYGIDPRTIFDWKEDGIFDFAEDTGYCFVLMQINGTVRKPVKVEFDPREPLGLLAGMAGDLNRTWWIGWV
jgi:hypothetical protein